MLLNTSWQKVMYEKGRFSEGLGLMSCCSVSFNAVSGQSSRKGEKGCLSL